MRGIEYSGFLILLLVMMLVSQVAFATVPEFGTAAESRYTREFPVPKGKAVIYIYQLDGNSLSPVIKLNNYEIGRLVPGAFTVWTLPPGQLVLNVGGAKSAGYSIRAKAGRIYLFRVSVKETADGPEAELSLMSRSSRSSLASIQLLKNPRTVSQYAGSKVVIAAAPKTPSKASSNDAEPESERSSEYDVPVEPGGFGIMLKLGTMTLSEDTQFIVSADRSFDDSVSPYGIEAYYQYPSGLTLGGEVLSYSASFTTVGQTDQHDVDVFLITANVKQYFRSESNLQPYIGAGLGSASTEISGPNVAGDATGIAYQLLGGLEYRGDDVGFFGEIKYIDAAAESDNNETVDVSGIGIFAGFAFHF